MPLLWLMIEEISCLPSKELQASYIAYAYQFISFVSQQLNTAQHRCVTPLYGIAYCNTGAQE